ncbi:MAG TPA: poly(3-hydroxyalkanoate) depolymerase [Jatrophihabitantaceae bacterium]
MTSELVRDLTVRGHHVATSVRTSVRPGDGRPLLLCNGIGANLGLLQPLVDALDPAIPVVRFDVPGVGASPTPGLPYRFATLAALVGDLLDQLDVDEVDVLGISWGGGLAQQFALQNPRRCKRLVLVSTGTGFLMVPGRPRVLAKMITPRRYREPEYAASIAGELYGGRMRDQPGLAAPLLDGNEPLGSRRGYFLQLAAGIGWTSLPFLPLLRQPTLLLAGDDDPIIPLVNAQLMRRLLPHATLHVFHDGHLGLLTGARELAPVIGEFLRGSDG